ncbi:MAG TPA: hypothetical protein VFU41_05610 [Gemmatimonadales bacterium]|nr:hypothetical protein [Gemmatimonadales bacterium]
MLLSAYPSSRLTAQDSQFGIQGLGTPGRFETVRARATGGAFAPFDAMSPLMEAQLGDVPGLTATAMGGTSYRDADLDGRTTSLRATRFPVLGFAQPMFRRLIVSGSYSTYLDKSWQVTLRDSIVLRGTMQPYTDDISSDGGVADLRIAAAARVSAHLAVGAGVHLLSGSARMAALRTFDAVGGDTLYQPLLQREDVRYTGLGFSGSALAVLGSSLRLAAFARADKRLRAWLGDDQLASEADLPSAVGGAVGWWPSPSARFAAAVAWRSWADAGPQAFNTVNWSAGAELGGRFSPVRLGVRGGRLPFGPGPSAPKELGFAAGTGMAFSQGRALLDVGVEHLRRTGSGLTERVWTFLAGLTIRP